MAVAIPSAEAGKMDVAVLVVGIPPADLEGVVARINVELGEAFGNTTMLAHPLVRDRRNDGGKMVIPSTEDLVVRRKMVKARSSVYPSPTYSWETQDGGIRKLRAFLLDRLVAPTVHAPGFHMGVAVRGEYASPVGSFNPHAGVSADDQVVEEVDLDELPNEEAEVQVKAARVAHRERHVAFFERNPEPDQFHLQGCGDCDVYCRTFGIQRPLPSEEVGAEEVGFGSRRREYAYGYDPPIG